MELDGAQIGILIVVGLILALFLKYKITGSIMHEFRFIGRILDKGYPCFAAIACAGSLMAATVGVLSIADVIMAPRETDEAVVTGKRKFHHAKQGTDYSVTAHSEKREYNESVSVSFHSAARKGDTLLIQLTPVFREWKSVQVVRDGRVIHRGSGVDMYAMVIMGAFFILTLYSFRLYSRMNKVRVLGSLAFIGIILFELIALAVLIC